MRLFFHFIILCLSLILLDSCYLNENYNNRAFEEKFAKEVEGIKKDRQMMTQEELDRHLAEIDKMQYVEKIDGKYDDPAKIMGISSPANDSSAYFDTAKLKLKQPQDYTPDLQIISQGFKNSAQQTLPQDIFDMNYNTNPYPPFVQLGADFDAIEIPKKDKFGVKSNLDDKQYLLVGNNVLQKNIDKIDSARTAEDIKISKDLINEQKEIRRKEKADVIFAEESDLKKEKNVEKNDEKWMKAKRQRREDSVQKIIAAQIIAQNVRQQNQQNQQNQQQNQGQSQQNQQQKQVNNN